MKAGNSNQKEEGKIAHSLQTGQAGQASKAADQSQQGRDEQVRLALRTRPYRQLVYSGLQTSLNWRGGHRVPPDLRFHHPGQGAGGGRLWGLGPGISERMGVRTH